MNAISIFAPLVCLSITLTSAPGQPVPHIATPPSVAQGAIFETRLAGGFGPLSVDTNEGVPLRTQLNGVSLTAVNAQIGSTRIDALVLSTDRVTVRALLPSRASFGPTNLWLTVKGDTYGTVSEVVPRKFTFLRRQVGDDWWQQERGTAAQVDSDWGVVCKLASIAPESFHWR